MKPNPLVLATLALAASCSSNPPDHLLVELTPMQDAKVLMQDMGANFGDAPDLFVGRSPDPLTGRSYVKFDLAGMGAVDGRSVRYVSLVMDVEDTSPGTDFVCDIRTVGTSWQEDAITWNQSPIGGSAMKTSKGVHEGVPRIYWDLTDIVRATLNGTIPDHGWLLVSTAPLNGSMEINSKEHPNGSGLELQVDLFELLLEVAPSGAQFEVSTSGARVGVKHYLYAGTIDIDGKLVPTPADMAVEMEDFKLVGEGFPDANGDFLMTVNPASDFPGAPTVYYQLLAKDGDWKMMSNRVETSP